MSDEFIIHSNNVAGPATHAIVIGVGDYPHLIGGSDPNTTDSADGMGQLTSPPISAKAFARWLIEEFENSDHPLATVQLLVSEDGPQTFSHPTKGDLPIKPANLDNIEEAVKKWTELVDEHLDGMAIFYFCGHGVSEGNSMVLLPSDFGSENNAYRHSIDFMNIYDSMEQYQATKQCFFIDACRVSSDSLNGNRGMNLLQNRPRTAEGTRLAPVYYSTVGGGLSHSLPGYTSWFTSALMNSLSHFGADKREGDWRVTNFGLADALDHIMDGYIQNGIQKVQTPSSVEVRNRFAINMLQREPNAILYLNGDPEERFSSSQLVCDDPSNQPPKQRSPKQDEEEGFEEWVVTVEAGEAAVKAINPDDAKVIGDATVNVMPPYQRYRLDCNG